MFVAYSLMIKSGITENLLDVVMKYITWDFINWIKYAEFSLLENSGFTTENQISDHSD